MRTFKGEKTMKYFINYGTGAGNEWVEGTLEDAKQIADQGTSYPGCSVSIYDENMEFVCKRKWWGCLTGIEDCVNPIQFGSFGFYDDWREYDI